MKSNDKIELAKAAAVAGAVADNFFDEVTDQLEKIEQAKSPKVEKRRLPDDRE